MKEKEEAEEAKDTPLDIYHLEQEGRAIYNYNISTWFRFWILWSYLCPQR